jgi:predicted transcriptional regulator
MSNEINYLEQKATAKILEIIADNNCEYTWYNVELRMNRLRGYPKSPPTYYIIKELVKLELIKELPPKGGSKYSRYEITQFGLNFLEKKKNKEISPNK